MVNFLILLSLLLTLPAQAMVVPSGVPQLGTSGELFISPSELYHATQKPGGWFTLIGSGSPGANNFNPFYRNGTAYQVPASTTTQCVSLSWNANGAAVAWQIVSDTSAITVGDTALTSGVYEGGTANVGVHFNTTVNVPIQERSTFNFGASTYAGWQEINAATNFYIMMKCREVAN